MRVLHVIHDFLPRHQAGSEIYAATICEALMARGLEVDVLCTDYDLARRHGTIRWRRYGDLRVIELINNWAFSSFAETYQSPILGRQLCHVLDAVRPDLLHIHNLLNLSFDLPTLARDRGIPSVATLHDYTLVCPSGGQRVHEAERHICTTIDVNRCARCFPQHNFHGRLVFGQIAVRGGTTLKVSARAAGILRTRMPGLLRGVTSAMRALLVPAHQLSAGDITNRLLQVERVFDSVNVFIAPSAHLGAEYRRLGIPAGKLQVSDYGFVPLPSTPKTPSNGLLRIGFVGTLVWYKGAHVLLDAARRLPPGTFEVQLYGDIATFPDYVATLQKLARGLPVRFLGRFERRQVADVYANIDVLVVPSLWPENSPLVIHEAFQSGVPVVGSRQGGTPDLVTHGRDGLLYEASSPAELAVALTALIQDPSRLGRMSRAAPQTKTIDRDAAEIVEVYERLVPSTGSSPVSTPRVGSTGRQRAKRTTAAVFLNYRTPDDTVLAVRSLQASRSKVTAIVVVDNASGDDSTDLLRRALPDVQLISAETNGGFSAGCNLGIAEARRCGADRILLLNSDVIVPPETVGTLERVLDADPRLGVVGPMLVSRADPEQVVSLGMSYSASTGRMRHRGFGMRRGELTPVERREVAGVSGCAMLIKREVLDTIGAFAEEFFFGFEDLDLCLRARTAGFTTACVETAVVLHEGGLSSGLAAAQRIYFATRNHLLLARRFSSSRSRASRVAQQSAILAFNLAHVLLTSQVPRQQGLQSFVRGVRDHWAGRYGSGEAGTRR